LLISKVRVLSVIYVGCVINEPWASYSVRVERLRAYEISNDASQRGAIVRGLEDRRTSLANNATWKVGYRTTIQGGRAGVFSATAALARMGPQPNFVGASFAGSAFGWGHCGVALI
jgi:hypothetical protein